MKGTNEEYWYSNSSEDSKFVEITEEDLDNVLRNNPHHGVLLEGKYVDPLFRY